LWNGRDVLGHRVMERWALGGRYGGVGRSLHVGGIRGRISDWGVLNGASNGGNVPSGL
jgi:hypothetical protein